MPLRLSHLLQDRIVPARRQRGQTTAEYALVLLVAGLVVGAFAAFVRTGALTEMFQSIVASLIERANG